MSVEIPGLPANWPELLGEGLADLAPDEFEELWRGIGKAVRAKAREKRNQVGLRQETET